MTQLIKTAHSRLLVLAGLAAFSAGAFAQDVGRVLSSTAIITQTQVPRQTCTQETVTQPVTTVSKSGAGAVMGGVAGAAIGNAIGNGQGRAAATMLGILGGAILGNKVEGDNVQTANATQNVQRCTTQTFLENRTTGYNVVYEYAGKQYSVVLPNDPGPSILLQIAPVATLQPAPVAAPAPVSAPVLALVAAPVVATPVTTSQIYVVPQQVLVTSPAVVVTAPVVTYAYPAVVGSTVVIGSSYYGHSHGHRGHGPNVYWSANSGSYGRAHYWR